MSAPPVDIRPEWLGTFTVRDQLALDALPDAVRAVVERYVRQQFSEWVDQWLDENEDEG